MKRHAIGLGLDYKYMAQYNSAIQSFIDNGGDGFTHVSIVGLSTIDQAVNFRRRFASIPIIHHLSNVEPGGLSGLNVERLKSLDAISRTLKCIWCCEDLGIWRLNDAALPYFAPPLYTEEMARFTARNIVKLQEISSVPFHAEIPSVGVVVGDLSVARFFQIVTEESGCGVVLDLSHVYSHAVALQQTWHEILDGFPLERVAEVHVAGGFVRNQGIPRYIDTHSHAIAEDVMGLLSTVMPRLTNCRTITYEIGCALPEDIFLTDLRKLNEALSS